MTQPPGLPPEGWYPNPDNTEQQRWWDGQAWTEHVAVGAPITPGYEPLPHQPTQPQETQPYQPAQPAYPAQPAQSTNPYGAAYQPYAPQPAYSPYAGQPGYTAYAGRPGFPPVPGRGVLPDGARVVSWWWRVLARGIDGFLVSIVSSILAASQYGVINRTNRRFADDLQTAVDANASIPPLHDYFWQGDYLRAIVWIGVSFAVVAFVYEVVMLKASSATVGKLICQLRVRSWDARGKLSWRAVTLRGITYQLAAGLPVVGGLYSLLDKLWPLWDHKKQALHDKAARTAVVKKHDAQVAPQTASTPGYGGYQPL
jgi:uncharacterized RDD family membrane protein YckC